MKSTIITQKKLQITDIYQILNKLNKLITETRESTHIQLTCQIILLYMLINLGENFLYNTVYTNKTFSHLT